MKLELNRSSVPERASLAEALIVEDHPDAARWLSETLVATFPGIRSQHAASLAAARQSLRSLRPDLVLLDLGLPDGNGTTLLRELRLITPRPTVVITTIFEDDEHLFAALRGGADGYILKDQSRDELGRLLSDIHAGRPPLSPSVARRLLTHFHPAPSEDTQARLSPREREVLERIARGMTIAACARDLTISPHTVGDHLKSIYRKLAVSSRAEAALAAQRLGLID